MRCLQAMLNYFALIFLPRLPFIIIIFYSVYCGVKAANTNALCLLHQ